MREYKVGMGRVSGWPGCSMPMALSSALRSLLYNLAHVMLQSRIPYPKPGIPKIQAQERSVLSYA